MHTAHMYDGTRLYFAVTPQCAILWSENRHQIVLLSRFCHRFSLTQTNKVVVAIAVAVFLTHQLLSQANEIEVSRKMGSKNSVSFEFESN